jgi:hypothetical protein
LPPVAARAWAANSLGKPMLSSCSISISLLLSLLSTLADAVWGCLAMPVLALLLLGAKQSVRRPPTVWFDAGSIPDRTDSFFSRSVSLKILRIL